jgi:hypothetical protein
MSNEMNGVEAPLAARRKMSKRSSTAVKLVQAAALAAVLVPLGSISVETTSCTFTGSGYGGYGYGAGCTPGTGGRTHFDFGNPAFFFELDLDSVFDPAGVTVTVDPLAIDQESFQARLPGFLAGYSCIEIDGTNCENFKVTVEAPGDTTWRGWRGLIHWEFPTALDGDLVRMLHEKGDRMPGEPFGDNTYDEDMCLTFGCVYDSDPSISSGDTDFQELIATLAPAADAVPEPGSVILVGTGISAWWYRRRRKRNVQL